MLTRMQITAFLTLSAIFWIGMLVLRGVPITLDMMMPFSTVVGAVSVCLLVFDRWLWRLPIFRGWLIKRPYLRGTWRAELKSDWVNPETQSLHPPIRAYMVVRQTASLLSFRLITEESRSETVASGVEPCGDGTFEITCTYLNTPRAAFRNRSEVHYGAMLLIADTSSPNRLEGEYWTDRKTTGSLALTDCRMESFMTFDECEEAFI